MVSKLLLVPAVVCIKTPYQIKGLKMLFTSGLRMHVIHLYLQLA